MTLVGRSNLEVGALLGVGAPAVANWKQRYADFPAPIAESTNSKVSLYDFEEVLNWYAKRFPEALVSRIHEWDNTIVGLVLK